MKTIPSKKIVTNITKSVLRGSLTMSSFICLTLFALGEITTESFFPEKYGFTRPTRRLLGLPDRTYATIAKSCNRKNLWQSLERLKKQGLVSNEKSKLKLTEKGKEYIGRIISLKKTLTKPWDKKYRVVIFDIPETKKHLRNWLRQELYLLNYIQLQKSVFVGKIPLPAEIIRDIERLGIKSDVNYLLAEQIFDDHKLTRR